MALIISTCNFCGRTVAAPLETCCACDTASPHTTPEAAPFRGEADAADVVLTVRDFAALERFARLQLLPDDPVAGALLSKLDNSRIMRVDAVGANVATLGSLVVFSVDDGPLETRVLVLPTRYAAASWTLPVTVPRGLALLGRAAGDVVTVPRRDAIESLYLIHFVHQPNVAATLTARMLHHAAYRPASMPPSYLATSGAGAIDAGGAWPSAHRPVLDPSAARTRDATLRHRGTSSIGGW